MDALTSMFALGILAPCAKVDDCLGWRPIGVYTSDPPQPSFSLLFHCLILIHRLIVVALRYIYIYILFESRNIGLP